MENVASMKDDDRDLITHLMGVSPLNINSKEVAPALRNRYYWTNIEINEKIQVRDIKLQDVLEDGYTN